MKIPSPLLCFLCAACALVSPAASAAATATMVQPVSADQLALPETDDGLPGAGPIRRYDWFKQLWNSRRTEWAGRVEKDQGAIVFLGDSITQGWGDVGSAFPGLKVANRGISGDTTRGVLIRLEQDVLALHPRGVVVLIGTNDLEEKAEPETIAGNLKLILQALRKQDATLPVILCSVFPSSESKHRPAEKIKKINELYRDAVQDEPQVTLLDTWSLFADLHGDAMIEEMPDLLHPNGLGYGKWAAALRPVMETVGLSPTWPDSFKPESGFVSLFNGTDLSGWSYEKESSLDGKTTTEDSRYLARNGRLVVAVSHRLREYKTLWTTRKFSGDFVLKLEFRASPNADSGVFVREPQLQCRDYLIAGPFATLKNYHPLDWNEIVVTVKGRLAHCTCNGEVLLDAMPLPATGPIGLESDHGQMEYRRIRLSETH